MKGRVNKSIAWQLNFDLKFSSFSFCDVYSSINYRRVIILNNKYIVWQVSLLPHH